MRTLQKGIVALIALGFLNATLGVIGTTSSTQPLELVDQVQYVIVPSLVWMGAMLHLHAHFYKFMSVDVYQQHDLTNRDSTTPGKATRATLTNLGVINSLLLTLHATVFYEHMDSSAMTLLEMWHTAIGWFAVGFCILGIMNSALALVYTDMLTDTSAEQLFNENPFVIGSPISCMLTSMVLLAMVGNLDMYAKQGVAIGLWGTCMWVFVFVLVMRNWKAFSDWKRHPTGSDAE